jgi:Protein of unknown function (DUF3223)
MPGHKVIITNGDSEKEFASKEEAKQFFRAMLARYRNGQTINTEDSLLLRGLLERHPEAHQKIGGGIRRFFRGPTDKGTDCFWLEREDGSEPTEFSFITCVNAKGKSLYQEFAEACREAVQPQLDEAKKKHFREFGDADGKVSCEVTDKMVAHYESHLDHKPPMTFQMIVTTFVAANKIEIRREMLSAPADAQFATTFVDDRIKQKFVDYHSTVAHLRIIAKKENLRLGGSNRLTKPKRPVILS